MATHHFSILLNPTYRCNADCDYCFENRTSDVMELDDFKIILQSIATYVRQQNISNLELHWAGGEIFTMDPEWLLSAQEFCGETAEKNQLQIAHRLQTNLIGYGPQWRRVVAEMFDDYLGSSLDFPNLYRKVRGGTPEAYNALWFRRYQEAKEAGINVGVIAVLNKASLSLGAEEFYSYYVDKTGIDGFQINTPYPGGPPTLAKRGFPLDNDLLSVFYSDLFALWMREGRPRGVSINPFAQLVHYFQTGENELSCNWAENCANSFIGVNPKGDIGQCEDWVSSYPDYVFGNLLACPDLATLLNTPLRKQFLDRPVRLMEDEDCGECEYLALCHGGCPARAYSTTGRISAKDPNCQSDKTIFKLARNAAQELDRLQGT